MNTQLAHRPCSSRLAVSLATAFAALLFSTPPAIAQTPAALQARIQEIKIASAANKQALAHYNWQESQTISIKGEVKKQQLFLVSIGPDGQQQKTPINAQPDQPSGGPLKRHIVAKKKEEFQEYGDQIADLARQYTTPDPGKLQAALQAGNISLVPGAGGEIQLVIKNYIKPGDQVTLVFNRQQKALQSIQVASYLDGPSDAVTIAAQFAKLPDGTNHVTGTQIDGVSKQLTVVTQNSTYQPV